MLSVEDEAFWEGLHPVTFGELPKLQDSVTVIGCGPLLLIDVLACTPAATLMCHQC